MNTIQLTGNLTRDPEVRNLPSGNSVCKMRLAVNSRKKVGEEWTDHANYFDVTTFGNRAENDAKYLTKGSKIAVSGRIEYREWEAEDGTKRHGYEVLADNVEYPAKDSSKEPTAEEPAEEPVAV